jgi:phospholipase/carboxylesterase
MMPLASSWKTSLPAARFATPDAPFRKVAGPGHLWFQVDGNQLRPDRLAEIRDAFDRTIDQIIKRERFEEALDRVAFVGVSQGAIVALDAAASGKWNVGALIGYSGLLPPVPVSSASSGTPVFLIHGQNDRTIPPFASTLAAPGGWLQGRSEDRVRCWSYNLNDGRTARPGISPHTLSLIFRDRNFEC